jgi:hypothetical protein
LAEVEMETLEEGREWMRQRMERKLQRLADCQGAIPPPFKRTGQFWTLPGEHHLMALQLARRNNDWDEIWEMTMQQC